MVGLGSTALDPLVDLLPMDGHFSRRQNADLHLVAMNGQNGDRHATSDRNRLTTFSTQD
jgi:hypothetical protein